MSLRSKLLKTQELFKSFNKKMTGISNSVSSFQSDLDGKQDQNQYLDDISAISGQITNDVISWDGTNWVAAAPSGGGGATWGYITGTLSSQTDLQTELDNKLDIDGGNANTDIDVGAYMINAQSFHAKGTGGNGHLGLKHQSANATASSSESSLFANSNGNLAWQNDNLYRFILENHLHTANRTFTLPDASGTIALTSNIGTWGGLNYPTWSSGTPFVKMTAAGTFSLDTNSYTNNILYDYTDGTAVTAASTNTISKTGTISANKLAVGDILQLNVLYEKNGVSATNDRIYINTTNSLSGATLLATYNTGATEKWTQMQRLLVVKGSTNTLIINPATSLVSDLVTSGQASSSINIDWTQTQYLICASQNNVIGDSNVVKMLKLTR